MKNNILKINRFIIICFLLLILNMTYWQIHRSEFLASHSANPRLLTREKETLRGSILDRNGEVLAKSVLKDGEMAREYPFGESFAHVVGYSTEQGIRTGLEYSFNSHLLGIGSNRRFNNFLDQLTGKPSEGLDLETSLDAELQSLGQELLGEKKGSIVVMQPETGAILALVSSPTFDPNKVGELWEKLNTDESLKPLLNRGTQGLYPPGSILKLMTGAGILENNPNFDKTYQCPGFIEIGNYKLTDLAAHGTVDFEEALRVSCNTTFAQMAISLGQQKFFDTATKFRFNQEIEFDLGIKKSFIPSPKEVAKEELAQEAIGQGQVLVTPIHMALLASTIANGGKMMQPFLVNGNEPQLIANVISEQTAHRIAEGMRKVVQEGTGRNAQIKGIEVAGKTGTAENPHGEPHSWFVGFAPFEEPEIVISVVVENGGRGGKTGAVLAKTILEKALKN